MTVAARERKHLKIHRIEERRVQWPTVIVIGGIHLAALLGLNPEYYSPSGLFWFFFFYFCTGMVGVTLSYHRLLTHRSFKTHKWFEYLITYFACLAMQSGPIQWTAMHRLHHKEADHEPDPHSPLVNFLWAHMGWLFMTIPGSSNYGEYHRFAKDLARDPVQRFYDKYFFVLYVLTAAALYLAGELYGGLGGSWLVWGFLVRTVVVWHATWFVNSATHLWGYRNYNTDEDSTNNWWVALLSFGEGWHNNHHADQRSAAHGQKWWEIDITYLLIRFLGKVGLAWDIMEPKFRVVGRRVDIMVDEDALRLADQAVAAGGVLRTLTDPTVPVEVPQTSSATEALRAATRSAEEALKAAEAALSHAAQAIEHKKKVVFERADKTVKAMLETAKDLAMTAVERAKIGAAEAAQFASQASRFAQEARQRASGAVHKASGSVEEALRRTAESARHAAEQSRIHAHKAAEAAARAAEEIAVAFQGIGRTTITAI